MKVPKLKVHEQHVTADFQVGNGTRTHNTEIKYVNNPNRQEIHIFKYVIISRIRSERNLFKIRAFTPINRCLNCPLDVIRTNLKVIFYLICNM